MAKDLTKITFFALDWSGVISDDRRPVYTANQKVLEQFGKPTMTFEEWLPRTTMTPIEFFANHGVHGDHDELFALYKKYYDEAIESGIAHTCYPDVQDVFQYLKEKNKKLAVLSSHPKENLIKEAKDYKLFNFLSLILGNSKDKAQGLKEICEKLGKTLDSTLYLGDTIFDIRAAKQAGVHSAGICTGYHIKERLEKENPEFLLEKLSDFKNPEKYIL